jgi:hypothetical protein
MWPVNSAIYCETRGSLVTAVLLDWSLLGCYAIPVDGSFPTLRKIVAPSSLVSSSPVRNYRPKDTATHLWRLESWLRQVAYINRSADIAFTWCQGISKNEGLKIECWWHYHLTTRGISCIMWFKNLTVCNNIAFVSGVEGIWSRVND